MLRRIMIFLTSLLLLLNSALVNASIGGWILSNPTAVGASILYDGTKGSATSSILISPNASEVAKVLRGGIALSFAVEQLLGAVDWVLDPANNQIVYTKPHNPYQAPTLCQNYFKATTATPDVAAYGCSIPQVAANYCKVRLSKPNVQGCTVSNFTSESFELETSCIKWDGSCAGLSGAIFPKYIVNSYFDPKFLPLITAAEQVIENAQNNNLDAQFTVLAAATNILSEAEQDDTKAKPIEDELNNNSKCPSGIVRNGSCWVCDKSLFMPYTRATRDAKNATRGKSCKNVTDTTVKQLMQLFLEI
ncbi:MAG: hypothetical protein GAK29_04228 [Acinetobacter bereziniae]|uniref:Uncharacterized protein n=1 Tax=Acinetobacter bereziniae TaxID=106648 RepID=A0A833PBK8_ACIBZ|nr:MAG: hypothetical protein GAK29_04228 [Acinetobacter bereziniae]